MNEPSSKAMQSLKAIESEAALFTLDIEHVLAHAGGDARLLIHLCDVFLHELPVLREQLGAGIAARNYLSAGRVVQNVRSALMIFESGGISGTAEALELAIHHRRVRQVNRQWKLLQLQFEQLVPQVQRLMLESSNPQTAVQ